MTSSSIRLFIYLFTTKRVPSPFCLSCYYCDCSNNYHGKKYHLWHTDRHFNSFIVIFNRCLKRPYLLTLVVAIVIIFTTASHLIIHTPSVLNKYK